MAEPSRVLVTDFDGTVTRRDFYELVVARCLCSTVPDYWTQYSSGRITHFEAMAGIFSYIRCSPGQIDEIIADMDPDPRMASAVSALEAAGWRVIVVSNGCTWYIQRILADLGVSVEVHGNPGEWEDGKGLLLRLPEESPYFDRGFGVDKSAVVLKAQEQFDRVVFAGNGPPDEKPALLVKPEDRFARTWLADRLTASGERFRRFDRWSEIAEALIRDAG